MTPPRSLPFACLAFLALALPVAPSCVLAQAPLAPPMTSPAADAEGNGIDFAVAGFGAGADLPLVRAALRASPSGGDDTRLLQAALDQLAARPAGPDGFRGALILAPGRFLVSGALRVRGSGLVLRGSGAGDSGTVLVATGRSRRTLLTFAGDPAADLEAPRPLAEARVPAGAATLRPASLENLAVGDRVVIRRPCTESWIKSPGMDRTDAPGAFAHLRLHWRPGSRDLRWDRTVVALDPATGEIRLDAPLTTALEPGHGGGTLARAAAPAARRLGLEHLRIESAFDASRPADEEHAWIAVAIDDAEDVFVRGVEFRHFVASAVRVGPRARRVTLDDCHNRAPVSERGGYRRQSFLVEGQQVLVRACTAEEGMNDFAVGQLAAGPVVFLDCTARRALGDSGSFESWSSGVLYENVRIEGAGLRLARDDRRAQGAGWTAANSLLWNCEAASLVAEGPPGAENRVVRAARPLHAAQRAARGLPAPAPFAAPADTLPPGDDDAPAFVHRPAPDDAPPPAAPGPWEIAGGRIVLDGRAVWGAYADEGWWRGQTYPAVAAALGDRSLTRFVPGREGPGLTENLPSLAAEWQAAGVRVVFGGPGLWYDRRRDAHLTHANDEHVWAPFFELPWARTGLGRAHDGLSLYDVSRYNPWFFGRTRAFAAECDRRGIVHYHYLYNTHNLLETASHWAEFPWRPANGVNDAGLPEPAPDSGRNTVHLADIFYNADHPGRRALHRAYIRHTLGRLADAQNIVFGVGAQFAGPLAFQRFFIDTVAEWERETGRRARLALTTSKDITDAILEDPERGPRVSIIDQRYWQYRPEGGMWAPRGDRNRAFREMTTEQFGPPLTDTPPPTTPALAYRQVREYRDRFPDRAILAWHNGCDALPAFMAGAAHVIMRHRAFKLSAADIPDMRRFDAFVRAEWAEELPRLAPRDGWVSGGGDRWCLADDDARLALVYAGPGEDLSLALHPPLAVAPGARASWFEPRGGERRDLAAVAGGATELRKPDARGWLLWLRR